MRPGQYIRCPIVFEEKDAKFPRNFVLAQVVSINELAETVTVKLHDLWKTKALYEHVFKADTFPLSRVSRCAAHRDAKVLTPDGQGVLLTLRTGSRQEADSSDGFYEYYVKLYDGSIHLYTEESLTIGYTACDYSPLQQMMDYEFQHPSWYGQRLPVSGNMHLVDNSVYGFSVLSGCRAFMMEHQITTVVRAFESRPIRQMLADEVGLGKTIEACAIIKILASENANLRVLYIVPGALAHQWQNELKYKFNLRAALEKSAATYADHFLLPLEELCADHPAMEQAWDVLVVDETHRLLHQEGPYSLVLSLSKATENVLLLSATPIQDRNAEYLRLLRLLLPSQYETVTLEDFSLLVKHQKKIQRKVNGMLRHLDQYEEYQEDIYDQLEELADFLDDHYLQKLLTRFDPDSEDHGRSVAELGISFITENYRIQRKVIRNRRAYLDAPMALRCLTELAYAPASHNDNYGEQNAYLALLEYLEEQNDGSARFLTETAQPLLMALSSSPWAFGVMLERLHIHNSTLTDCAALWISQAEDELARADYLLDEAPDEMHSRLLRAADYIEQEVFAYANGGKLVVFTSFVETLQAFQRLLSARKISFVSFCHGMSREALEDSVYTFQNEAVCRIILCDETGGEGRNFQNADWLIHLDLPWTANAIEQRIGRLDRLGRDAGHMTVHSVVLYAIGTIEEQLFHIWNKGMNLFQESLSGLEIITGELNAAILDAMGEDLSGGLRRALDDIMEMTADAKDAVEEEQLYDSGTIIYKPLSLAVKTMLKLYQSEEGNLFQTSMMSWAAQAGLWPTKCGSEILTQFEESRFSPKAAMQSLLLPPDWKRYQLTDSFRRSHAIRGTFDRTTAIKREDLLFFAPGDTVFDSIVGNAVHNGRGRCSVFSGKAPFSFQGFVYCYNVGPDISYLLDHGVPLPLVSQFSVYLPLEQIRIYLPLNDASAAVSRAELDGYFQESFRFRVATHQGERSGAPGCSRIERFMDSHPREDWVAFVKKHEKEARKQLMERCREGSDLETAKKEIARLVNGYEAEYTYLGKDPAAIRNIREQYQAVYTALRRPAIVLDSICFMRLEN